MRLTSAVALALVAGLVLVEFGAWAASEPDAHDAHDGAPASEPDGSDGGMPPVGQPVKRKDWSWTLLDARGLALGGGGLAADDVEDLRERGFRAVINYRTEAPEEEPLVVAAGMDYLFIDSGHAEEDVMTLDEVERAVAFIEENLDAGRPVYAHCIGGWHRSAIGPAAYLMKTRQLRAQEAWDQVASLRPGIEPRYMDALLVYEAHLYGGPKLTVDLWTERWDVEPNETVDVHALVTHNGQPIEGARLAWAADHRAPRGEVVTDASGLATFPFPVQPKRGQEFLSARASKEGYTDGYDRNVLWVNAAKMRDPTVLELEGWTGVASPGGDVALVARVKESDGGGANARITVTTPCETLFREYTGWDGKALMTFRAPMQNGTYPVLVHANRFPAEPVFERLVLVVGDGAGGAMPPCVPPAPALVVPEPPEPRVGERAEEVAEEVVAGFGGVVAAGKVLGFFAVAVALFLGARHRPSR